MKKLRYRMSPHCVPVCVILLLISGSLEAKLRYAFIFPSSLQSEHPELACLHMEGLQGFGQLQVFLISRGTTKKLVERTFPENPVFTCLPIMVPKLPGDDSENMFSPEITELEVIIKNSGESTREKRTVTLKPKKMYAAPQILIQTDKSVYKPGQTVKFRIVSLNANFEPADTKLDLVELQDPRLNRIGQWLEVKLNQGMADLSYPLSSEPQLGEYTIIVKSKVHKFSVEEYVLPRFEVIFELPQFLLTNKETFPVKICARYTFGKPVSGQYKGRLCRRQMYGFNTPSSTQRHACVRFKGELDKLGCAKLTMKSYNFYLQHPTYTMLMSIEGKATVTEKGTGIELSASGETRITTIDHLLAFPNAKKTYRPGIPYSGTVEVLNEQRIPVPAQKVYLTCRDGNTTSKHTLITDGNGHAAFKLNNTKNWVDNVYLTASTMEERILHFPDFNTPRNFDGHLTLMPLYSDSKSYLSLQPAGDILSCDPEEEVYVEYIIRHTALEEKMSPLLLHYLVTSKSTILNSGSQAIPLSGPNKDLHGEVTLKLPVTATNSSSLQALVFILLPNGEIIADSVKIREKKCFKNHVKVGFSPDEVLPGSDVSLQVQAAPGSLCGLRVVDQSVVLMKPEAELTVDKVHALFHEYDVPLYLGFMRGFSGPDGEPRRCRNRPGEYHQFPFGIPIAEDEIHKVFMDMNLNIITSAPTTKPLLCPDSLDVETDDLGIHFSGVGPGFVASGYSIGSAGMGLPGISAAGLGGGIAGGAGPMIPGAGAMFPGAVPLPSLNAIPGIPTLTKPEFIRKYFPETWIWELMPVGNSGIVELHRPVPDTITDWNAGAMCMGPNGFGLSPSVPLRVFQPFFVELALPYSVVRGESFTLKASVFNYMQQCIKVQTVLLPSLELERELCSNCQYNSCLCAKESKTFYWNVTASKLGEVNITVRTEAISTTDMCDNEIPIVPKWGNIDTVIKPIIVKPGGILVEKSHNFMVCIPVGQVQANPEEFSLKVPEDILEDSERAYVTLVGDIMGTAMQNMDRLLAMPYGCGEQNMVRFAPNIFVLQYLEKTNQLTDEIKSKATEFMEKGYQGQLKYKDGDGSYSAFGNSGDGNTWLTAFVVKSFSKAKKYIYIDEILLSHSFSWLTKNRYYTGCFRNVGKLFQSALKGGVEDDVSLSAYVTIALLEADLPKDSPVIRDSVNCLQRLAMSVTNMYTQALLAYAFTLYGDMYNRQIMLNRLEQRAVRREGELYWQPRPTSPSDPFWHRASSTEVELTSYVLLALLSAPSVDFLGASQIVRWLSKQQNAFGGFSSTQDTVVALQALSKYAEAVYTGRRDVTVTITSKTRFLEKFHVNNNNRLLLQRATVPGIPGNYTVTTTGSGCIYLQTVLRYNIPAKRSQAAFMITLDVKSTQCTRDLPTQLEMSIAVVYVGSRQRSNMAIIEVNMLSGFTAVTSSIELLKMNRVIQRAETGHDVINLYLDEIGRSPIRFAFTVEQEFPILNLKPTTVKVYDYYQTDEYAIVDYRSPCTWL
ncbi:alpha-2-macroglobulin-like protein 1 [Lithobates pipiens]